MSARRDPFGYGDEWGAAYAGVPPYGSGEAEMQGDAFSEMFTQPDIVEMQGDTLEGDDPWDNILEGDASDEVLDEWVTDTAAEAPFFEISDDDEEDDDVEMAGEFDWEDPVYPDVGADCPLEGEELGHEVGRAFAHASEMGFPEIGFLKAIGKVAKSVVRSPITKMTAAGLSVAFPAVGVPMAAGIAVADKVVTAAESKSKVRRRVGRRIIKATAKAAKVDKDAARALRLMRKVVKHKKKLKKLTRKQRKARAKMRAKTAKTRRECMKLYAKAIKSRKAWKSKAVKAQKALKRLKKRGPRGRGKALKGFLVTASGRVKTGRFLRAA